MQPQAQSECDAFLSQKVVAPYIQTPPDPSNTLYNHPIYWRCINEKNVANATGMQGALAQEVAIEHVRVSNAQNDATDYQGQVYFFGAILLVTFISWWVSAHKRRIGALQLRGSLRLLDAANTDNEREAQQADENIKNTIQHNKEFPNNIKPMGIVAPTWDDILARSEVTVQTIATRLSPKKQHELLRDKDLAEAEHKERLMLINVQQKAKEAVIVVLEEEKKREQERWKAVTDTIKDVNKSMLLVQEAMRKNPAMADLFPQFETLLAQLTRLGGEVKLDMSEINETVANSIINKFFKDQGLNSEDGKGVKGKDDGDVWKG